jgi:hypothetical protein
LKQYVDGTLEGSPEELAAYKHIDAMLARKNKPAPKAIEAKKAPVKKERSKNRVSSDAILLFIEEREGATAADIAEQFPGLPRKAAYNRLYQLRKQNKLWLTDRGVFKLERNNAEKAAT